MRYDMNDVPILVAGGSGFLGSHVVERLAEAGYSNIIVNSRRSESPRLTADFTSAAETEDFFKTHKPEIVINLAALAGGIGLNKDRPADMFYINMSMGLNITQNALKYGCKKYLYVGSICSYPKFTPVPFKEENLWDGYPEETNAPYGIVKKAIGTMIQAYSQQYGFNGLWLMPVNLYGPRDNFDLKTSHVIPALIRKFDTAVKEGHRSVSLWGDGKATREFLYVDDCAKAIVLALQHLDDYSNPINIGNGTEINIKSLAYTIADLIGYTGEIVWDIKCPNGQPRRCLDTSKAKELFGFQATTTLVDGLKKTIEWYRSQHGKS
jgi:GDP-L-fucose synthase